MASIHRDSRSPKGVWYAVYRLGDGRQIWRSTKTRDKSKAKIIAEAWHTAEDAAAFAELSQDRVLEVLNETLKRIGASSIEYVSVSAWLREWLGSKEGQIAESTQKAYAQAWTNFLTIWVSTGQRAGSTRLRPPTSRGLSGFCVKRADRRLRSIN
jgi:hypothetical protein